MQWRFRKVFHIGPLRLVITPKGIRSIGIGRVTKTIGRTVRVKIPTGIRGLALVIGGSKAKRKRHSRKAR